MNKVVSALVVAFAGAAAASLLATWRKNRLEAKALEKKDIHRWEDDGGKIPGHSAVLRRHR